MVRFTFHFRRKLTEQAAWQLSEEIKADWWDKNKQRFVE